MVIPVTIPMIMLVAPTPEIELMLVSQFDYSNLRLLMKLRSMTGSQSITIPMVMCGPYYYPSDCPIIMIHRVVVITLKWYGFLLHQIRDTILLPYVELILMMIPWIAVRHQLHFSRYWLLSHVEFCHFLVQYLPRELPLSSSD